MGFSTKQKENAVYATPFSDGRLATVGMLNSFSSLSLGKLQEMMKLWMWLTPVLREHDPANRIMRLTNIGTQLKEDSKSHPRRAPTYLA